MRRLSLLLLAIIFVFGACVKLTPKYEPTPSAGPWGSSGTSTSEIPNIVYSNQTIADIPASQASTIIDRGKSSNIYILDFRTDSEFRKDHIKNAVNLNPYAHDFDDKLKKLDKGKVYVIYCEDGNSSSHIKYQMKNLDFETVYKINGGFQEWINNGYPSIGEFHKTITPSEASEFFYDHFSKHIVDLRRKELFDKTHLNNAENIEYTSESSVLYNKFRHIGKNDVIFLYSETGSTGESAMSVLKDNNYRRIYNIQGGIQRWQNEGLPIWKHPSIIPVNNTNTNTAK